MEAKDLRALGADELKNKVGQWRDELFRAKFKAQSSEAKDTSVFRKLRRDIARGETILTQLRAGNAPAIAAKPAEDKAVAAPKKATAKKTTTRKKAAKE